MEEEDTNLFENFINKVTEFLGYKAGESSSKSSLTNSSEESDSEEDEYQESIETFNQLFEERVQQNQIRQQRAALFQQIFTQRLQQFQARTNLTRNMAQYQPTAIETLFLGGNQARNNARSDSELVATVTTCAKGDRATLKNADKKAYEKLRESCCAKVTNATFELIKPIDSKTAASQLKEVTSVISKVKRCPLPFDSPVSSFELFVFSASILGCDSSYERTLA